MKYTYIATFQEEDGFVQACVPCLPFCSCQGKNKKDALHKIIDAASVYLCSLEEDKEKIPKSLPQQINQNQWACPIVLDTEAYRKKLPKKNIFSLLSMNIKKSKVALF